MGTQRIALHFTDPQTALIGTPTRRLMGADLALAGPAGIHLVIRQMLETHEIQRAHEDIRVDLHTGNARIQNIVTGP